MFFRQEHLHCVLPAQVLHPRLEVDGQVLGGVIVIHVVGDIIVHAADGIYQFRHSIQFHDKVVVRDVSDEVLHLLLDPFHPLVVVDGIDFLDLPGHVHQGVPVDAQHV